MLSNKRGDHLTNLWHIFYRCCKYGISMNPQKSIFVVTEGKLLGYVVCKERIIIDPKEKENYYHNHLSKQQEGYAIFPREDKCCL